MTISNHGHERNIGVEKYPRKQKKSRDVLLWSSCSLSLFHLFYAVLQGSAVLLKFGPAQIVHK